MFLAGLLVPVICCAAIDFGSPSACDGAPAAKSCSIAMRACQAHRLEPARKLCGPVNDVLPGVTESVRLKAGLSPEPALAAMLARPLDAVELFTVAPRFCNPVGTVQLRI